MASVVRVAVSTVQTIWKAHGLVPHRFQQFKLSNDSQFVEKLHDIFGLYVSPPAHALVLSIDEKWQIQALDRTQPGLPLKKGRGTMMTHDYKRNGMATLFAALNVLDGTVIGQNMRRPLAIHGRFCFGRYWIIGMVHRGKRTSGPAYTLGLVNSVAGHVPIPCWVIAKITGNRLCDSIG